MVAIEKFYVDQYLEHFAIEVSIISKTACILYSYRSVKKCIHVDLHGVVQLPPSFSIINNIFGP